MSRKHVKEISVTGSKYLQSVCFFRISDRNAISSYWFHHPTRSSLWRVWRIINGEPPFLPPLIIGNYPGTTNYKFEHLEIQHG